MHKMLKDAGKDFSFEYLRDLLMAPTLSPLLTARSKEQIYLKTGLCLSSSSEKNAGELRDMVEEAEEVMKVFGIEKIRGLDSAPNIRRALAVNLPWTGNFSKRF